TSLLPGLLHSLQANARYGVRSAALFEVGVVFYPADPGPGVEEHERLAFAMTGPAAPPFPGDARDVDFFDAKGAVEALLGAMAVVDWKLGEAPPRRLFHPGRSASVLAGDELIGE